MRRRKFLDGFHLNGIVARYFAHTGVYSVPRIGEGASCERTKTAGCPCNHDHLFHWGSPMMFCLLPLGFRLSQDEETALHLVPGGAVRREMILVQNGAQEARAQRFV